jgi:hypothetical protein
MFLDGLKQKTERSFAPTEVFCQLLLASEGVRF